MNLNSHIDDLPDRLSERTRRRTSADLGKGSILYWMRNAARGHENPALDTAVSLANHLSRSVLVVHLISALYPYASDRHHTFQLEGARDVAEDLAQRQIPYALCVQSEDQPQLPLKTLVDKAGLLVVEEVPIQPFSIWGPALGDALNTPVLSVDTDCVVPMTHPDTFHDRAYTFRNAMETARDKRMNRDWPAVQWNGSESDRPSLPFDPVDPMEMDIDQLVARCPIDHGVGPVPHRTGGATAGYKRWADFRENGLSQYHRKRNNPAQPGAVSRLSPYLHYGHISPFRVAREANEQSGDGPQKFIDEFVTWRELAHHFCFTHDDYNRFSALPNWSRETLRDHAPDERPRILDWDQLSRAQTGDRLWDLCQQSLLTHGELHNNVRMTWGKQLLQWTRTPQEALRLAIDLNNRYALDGRDPNSYGGILWCFGLFDSPRDRERSIIGRLRPRTTDWHVERIQMDEFTAHVHRPLTDPDTSVAIIGAGISGATAARVLQNHRIDVEVFEKSRGSGGRAATRRVERDEATLRFDHGAQFFTTHSPVFRRVMCAFRQRGRVEAWNPRLGVVDADGTENKPNSTERFVALPGMSDLAGELLGNIDISASTRVTELRQEDKELTLYTKEGGSRTCDAAIVTAPPPQAAEIVSPVSDDLADTCNRIQFEPVWGVMLGFDTSLDTPYDALFVNDGGPLSWVALNTSKPGRSGPDCWVLHATADWTRSHLEAEEAFVVDRLRRVWRRILDVPGSVEPVYSTAHRWRYARAEQPLNRTCLVDEEANVVVAGDALVGNRVEGAYRSGRAAAGRVLQLLLDQPKLRQQELF